MEEEEDEEEENVSAAQYQALLHSFLTTYTVHNYKSIPMHKNTV